GPRHAGDTHEPFGALNGSDLVAPDGVRRRIVFDALAETVAQTEFILRMERGAPSRVPQDLVDALVVFHQQVASGGTHEHLDSRRARQALQRTDMLRVLARAADPEGEVAV